MKASLVFGPLSLFFVLISGQLHAAIILDQINDGGWSAYGPNNYQLAQTFTCGTNGTLSSLDVYLWDFGNADITVRIQTTHTVGIEIVPSGTVLATAVIPAFSGPNPEWVTADFSASDVELFPGLMLAYTLSTASPTQFRDSTRTTAIQAVKHGTMPAVIGTVSPGETCCSERMSRRFLSRRPLERLLRRWSCWFSAGSVEAGPEDDIGPANAAISHLRLTPGQGPHARVTKNQCVS